MTRLIDADDLLTAFPVDDEPSLTKSCVRMTIQRMPTVDAVPVEAYRQVQWERDVAMQQLDALGYGLGEKVVPVVRCKDCKHWDERRGRKYCWEMYFDQSDPDFYCGYAERKE